ITATFSFALDRPDDYRREARHGGGALLDVGVYGVALSRWLAAQEPVAVRALTRVGDPTAPGAGGDDRCDVATSALLQFGSGTIAAVHSGFDTAERQHLEVIGTTATITMPRAFTGGRDA